MSETCNRSRGNSQCCKKVLAEKCPGISKGHCVSHFEDPLTPAIPTKKFAQAKLGERKREMQHAHAA